MLISAKSFLIEVLGYLMYRIMSSTNRYTVTSFLICIPFISFSFLSVLARFSRTILTKNEENGWFCLIPDISGKAFGFFPFYMVVTIVIVFIMLRHISSIPNIYGTFNHEERLDFVKGSFCGNDYVISVLDYIYMVESIYCFTHVTLHPGMKPAWLCWMIFSISS